MASGPERPSFVRHLHSFQGSGRDLMSPKVGAEGLRGSNAAKNCARDILYNPQLSPFRNASCHLDACKPLEAPLKAHGVALNLLPQLTPASARPSSQLSLFATGLEDESPKPKPWKVRFSV